MSYRKKLSPRDRPPEEQRAAASGTQHAGQKPKLKSAAQVGIEPDPSKRNVQISRKQDR